MILQSLVQLYEDLVTQGRIARPGWVSTKVQWALSIDEQGELLQVIPLLEQEDGKKPRPQKMELPAPVKRSSGVAANFLWDNSSYLLGVDNKGKPERSKSCFAAAAELHHQILDGAERPDAKALLRFFDTWKPEAAESHPALQEHFAEFTAGGNLVFFLKDHFVHDETGIRVAWMKHYHAQDDPQHRCMVTGQPDQIVAVHPAVKGVDGAQSSGAALVSFNAPAFCSYGKEQGHNAPVGQYASFAYTAALNHLLADREHVQKIGDTTIVCWASGAKPQYPALSLAAIFGSAPPAGMDENAVRSAVRRLAEGLPCPELDLEPERPFYILGIAPNAARLSVRFFYRDTFGALMRNVNAHHTRMEIVRPANDPYETIPLWAMLRETVNPNSRDKAASPVLSGAAARAIFTGSLYPAALLESTMLRIRAERKINRGKAAIIKAYYLRNTNAQCPEEVLTVSLNETSTNVPYNLGRLFALYEAAQEAANPGINSTIRDKYFNSAASTPGTIFPILTNLYQKHLRKLPIERTVYFDKQVTQIMGNLPEAFPVRLTLPEQGAFQLGYYHQTQKRFTKKEEQ